MLAEPRSGVERSEGRLELFDKVQRPQGRGGLHERDNIQAVSEYHMGKDTPQEWARRAIRIEIRHGMGILRCARHNQESRPDARAGQLTGMVDDGSVFAPLTGADKEIGIFYVFIIGWSIPM